MVPGRGVEGYYIDRCIRMFSDESVELYRTYHLTYTLVFLKRRYCYSLATVMKFIAYLMIFIGN